MKTVSSNFVALRLLTAALIVAALAGITPMFLKADPKISKPTAIDAPIPIDSRNQTPYDSPPVKQDHPAFYKPDLRLRPDDYTVLMADDAILPAGVQRVNTGGHGKFQEEGWTKFDQKFEWQITAPKAGNYVLNILVQRLNPQPFEVTVSCNGQNLRAPISTPAPIWNRHALPQTLRLSAGTHTLSLQGRSPGHETFQASLFSLELVRPEVRDSLRAAARKMRTNARWMQKARFGLMCHWTNETMPREGEKKPYAEAVRAFDVERFANDVQHSGAGFVVFTTSHAQMFFPAPLTSLDRILPGRTAPRDLVKDLADALAKRNIKLMLYFHIGAVPDTPWLQASGFWETDTTKLWNNWTAIIGEVGERYRDKVAGWWFDDGTINYYYRSAPWQRLATVAKKGNPRRVIGFNSWVFPSATAFQDFFTGEYHDDPSIGGWLPVGGDGKLVDGSHRGLQACATLLFDEEWIHNMPNTPIAPPRWNVSQLTEKLAQFAAHRNVPIFNCGVYQDGRFSPQSLETLHGASRTLANPPQAITTRP